jgi:hypothetical protein
VFPQDVSPAERVGKFRLIASPSTVRVSTEKFSDVIDCASETQTGAGGKKPETTCSWSGRAFRVIVPFDARPSLQLIAAGVAHAAASRIRCLSSP